MVEVSIITVACALAALLLMLAATLFRSAFQILCMTPMERYELERERREIAERAMLVRTLKGRTDD
jgi:hypothetical protein